NGVVKGTKSVTGKAEPNADVTIVTPFETATVKADAEGKFNYTSPETFVDKQEVTVTAKAPGKTVSDPVKVIVGVDKSELEQAIKDGNQALEDNPNTPPTNADNKLKDAIENGETVKNDPNATQEQVDEATQKIKEAMDQKAAEDAVKALEEKQKEGQPITPEEIQDAQDKIDKLPGSIEDPTAPDYNQDKKDLQDRLDKVKAVEELKDLVEKADEVLNDEEKIKEKPAEIVEKVVTVKEKGDIILVDNGATTEIEKLLEVIKELKQALEDIEKDFVSISIRQISAGTKSIQIKTRPIRANIIIFVDGNEIASGKTDGLGNATVTVRELSEGQKIKVKGSHPGYLDNEVSTVVK
ncbi:MAG: hypothetical protein Q4Q17_05785, partial [Tissierellia bacterium]|nr:hypothetical protein [Tissierellia bacterium]